MQARRAEEERFNGPLFAVVVLAHVAAMHSFVFHVKRRPSVAEQTAVDVIFVQRARERKPERLSEVSRPAVQPSRVAVSRPERTGAVHRVAVPDGAEATVREPGQPMGSRADYEFAERPKADGELFRRNNLADRSQKLRLERKPVLKVRMREPRSVKSVLESIAVMTGNSGDPCPELKSAIEGHMSGAKEAFAGEFARDVEWYDRYCAGR